MSQFLSYFQWAEKTIFVLQVAQDEGMMLAAAGMPDCGVFFRFALSLLLKACQLYRPTPASPMTHTPPSRRQTDACFATMIMTPPVTSSILSSGAAPSRVSPSPLSFGAPENEESGLVILRIGRIETLLKACKEVLLLSSAS
jgi:hypothetical protein